MGLRVLHLIDSGGLYGAERMLLALVEQQIKEGLEPTILSAGEPGAGEKAIECEARRMGLPVIPWRMKPGLNLKHARRIVNWATENGVHIFHSHGYKFNILIGLFPKRWRTEIPLVCTLHGYVKAPRWTKMAVYEMLDRVVLKGAESVVVVDDGMRALLPANVAASSSCLFIPNGITAVPPVAPPALPPLIQSFVKRHVFNVLAVGRLSPEKGFDVLLEALADQTVRLGSVGAVVVGEGRLKESLQTQAGERGLAEHILFPGYHADAAALMPHFDALVMPSRTEGLPITVLEALRARVPIVATRVGGLPGVLSGLPAAKLVNPDDPEDLAASLMDIIQRKPSEEALDMSASAFASNFSATSMATRYTEVYCSLLDGELVRGRRPRQGASLPPRKPL